jgi:hypothetical protein
MYRLIPGVTLLVLSNGTKIEDNKPRPAEFFGKRLQEYIERGFLEEVKEDKQEPTTEGEVKEEKKKK